MLCALCLAKTMGEQEIKAVTVANGFAMCPEHFKAQAGGFEHRMVPR